MFASPLRRNWRNTEETELKTPRRPGKMAHRKLGLAPSNFTYEKCLDRKRIEGERRASHPNTNSPSQRVPLSAGCSQRGAADYDTARDLLVALNKIPIFICAPFVPLLLNKPFLFTHDLHSPDSKFMLGINGIICSTSRLSISIYFAILNTAGY